MMSLFTQSWATPTEAALRLLSMPIRPRVLWEALLLLAILNALAGAMLVALAGVQDQSLLPENPLVRAAISAVAIAGSAAMAWFFGYIFGGTGRFDDALQLTVWYNAAILPVQIAVGILAGIPALGGIAAVAFLIFAIRMAAQFVAVLHGFQNLMMVLLGMGLAVISVSVVLAIIAVSAGIVPIVIEAQ